MRVTYLGIENGYHITEWNPSDERHFPTIQLQYNGADSNVQIMPHDNVMTMAGVMAFQYAYISMTQAYNRMLELENMLFEAGHEYDVSQVCRTVVDMQNKIDYDVRGS